MPNLSIGIVGLPNVGKSTLFNALVSGNQAEASNYPFCTIEPNTGLVPVPDVRMDALSGIVNPERVVPAVVEFVDIAGIIEGASKGEGLGNQFLAHIRETAAIAFVVRCFENPDIIHVNGAVDPSADLATVQLELALADLATVTKALDRYRKAAKQGGEAAEMLAYAEGLITALDAGSPAYSVPAKGEAAATVLRELQLLTAKPFLVIANVAEGDAALSPEQAVERFALPVADAAQVVVICAKLEAELRLLEPEEQAVFLQEYGLQHSGLERLIQASYRLLGLQTYFTAGKQEVRAWTIPIGATAPEAAGVIHTDFTKGFIRAETIAYGDYVAGKGEEGAKAAGKLRSEGKEYIVKDGDVLHFRFNV